MLPPVATCIGWFASRSALIAIMRARIAARRRPRRAAPRQSRSSLGQGRVPVAEAQLGCASSCRVPAGSSAMTRSTTAAVSPPKAPAFMRTAPPMVPGMPMKNSSPASPARCAVIAIIRSVAPAPTTRRSPSTSTSASGPASFTTTPSSPPSRTRMLEATPIGVTGTRGLAAGTRSGRRGRPAERSPRPGRRPAARCAARAAPACAGGRAPGKAAARSLKPRSPRGWRAAGRAEHWPRR